MIPQSFIADLLNRIDIVDVVGAHVQLKKGGANLMGLCPFHNEKSPSFTVSPAKQFYHCFGCGAHGSAIGFLMEHAGLSYVDAIRDLAQSIGMVVPEEPGAGGPRLAADTARDLTDRLERAAMFFQGRLEDAETARAYLNGRGLTRRAARIFRIGYAPDEWNALKEVFGEQYDDRAMADTGLTIDSDKGTRYDRFRGRVIFPIRGTRGAIIGFGGRVIGAGEPKYLNSPETPLFDKGRELYGLFEARQAIREAGRVIVVEGYMDVVALAQAGIGYAVATLGTACTPAHVQKLARQADRVVFCFDGDAAGRRAARRALENSLSLVTDDKVFAFLFLPPEHDPDSYVREHGRAAFEALEREALPLSRVLIDQLREEADLGSAEGRAALVSAAKPQLLRIAAPGLRLGLVKEIAFLVDMMPTEVERLCDLKPQAALPRVAPPRVARAPMTPLDEQIVRLLVRDPGLATREETAQNRASIPAESPVHSLLDAITTTQGPVSAAWLFDRFGGGDLEPLLRRAQVEELEIEKTAEVVVSEYLHALEALRGQWRHRRMQELAPRVAAETGAREEYSALLGEETRLRARASAS
ncbi:MAG: DNA primase [Burkholderiales bacterium]